MNSKSYTLQVNLKDGSTINLDFGYEKRFRKWAYRAKGQPTMIVACKGVKQGQKVASQICGSLRRNGKIDGLCRSSIEKILNPLPDDEWKL